MKRTNAKLDFVKNRPYVGMFRTVNLNFVTDVHRSKPISIFLLLLKIVKIDLICHVRTLFAE